MTSNIKDMLKNLTPTPTPFHVPSWNSEVLIRALTEKERKGVAEMIENENLPHEDMVKAVCKIALVTPDGTPVYDGDEEFPDNLWFGGFTEINTAITQLTLGTFEAAKKN